MVGIIVILVILVILGIIKGIIGTIGRGASSALGFEISKKHPGMSQETGTSIAAAIITIVVVLAIVGLVIFH